MFFLKLFTWPKMLFFQATLYHSGDSSRSYPYPTRIWWSTSSTSSYMPTYLHDLMIWLARVRFICHNVFLTSSPSSMSAIVDIQGMRPNLGWSNTTNWPEGTVSKINLQGKSLWVERAYLSKYLNKPFGRKLWLVLCAKLAWYAADDWKQNLNEAILEH